MGVEVLDAAGRARRVEARRGVVLEGRRFVNEARSYHEFVRAQLRRPDTAIPAWLVCDSRFLWKYGLGKVRPFAWSTRRERAEGYLTRGATLADLAREIGVPPERFVATVQAFNREAAQGRDPEFGRGGDGYQRHLGDAEHPPNPCVVPLQRGPFHAVKVLPADLGMSAGIRTDERARVFDAAGCPIPGLYACGNDAHSTPRARRAMPPAGRWARTGRRSPT